MSTLGEKKDKPCSGENDKNVAGQLLAKEIMHLTCGYSQPSQQKHCQLAMKGIVIE